MLSVCMLYHRYGIAQLYTTYTIAMHNTLTTLSGISASCTTFTIATVTTTTAMKYTYRYCKDVLQVRS
jgi:hypothetical protein